jgi:hypothetical protein
MMYMVSNANQLNLITVIESCQCFTILIYLQSYSQNLPLAEWNGLICFMPKILGLKLSDG